MFSFQHAQKFDPTFKSGNVPFERFWFGQCATLELSGKDSFSL